MRSVLFIAFLFLGTIATHMEAESFNLYGSHELSYSVEIGSCHVEIGSELFYKISIRTGHGTSKKTNRIELPLDKYQSLRVADPSYLECAALRSSIHTLDNKNFPHNVRKSNLRSVVFVLKLFNFEHEMAALANARTLRFLPKFKIHTLVESGFSLGDLKKSGVPIRRLLDARYTIKTLVKSGFTLGSFRNANVHPAILMEAGFTMIELFIAGYPLSEIVNARG